MMDLSPFWYGLGAIFLVVVMVAFGPVVWKMASSQPSPTPPAVTTPPATTATTTSSITIVPSWMNWKIVAGGVALIILLVYFWEKVPGQAIGVIGAVLMAVVAALLFFKGGVIGKWVGVLFLLMVLVFGEHALEVGIRWQNKFASVVLDDKPIFSDIKSSDSATVPRHSNATSGSIAVDPSTMEWSPWIRVGGDRCIWINDVNPDQVRARADDSSSGQLWNEYQARKARGEVGDFRWVSVRSDGTMSAITYEFRRRGMCS